MSRDFGSYPVSIKPAGRSTERPLGQVLRFVELSHRADR
jgi:hypothetical protein